MKNITTLLIALFISLSTFAQQGINYKAIIKDDLGNIIASEPVQIQFNILKGMAQTNEYSEWHGITTDANGIIIVNIGEGNLVTGSPAFNTLDWASDTHFLEVELNLSASGITNLGITEFKAVPYAKHAEKALIAQTANNVSGLELITENGKTGWRLIGVNTDNYGFIGNGAVDLSRQQTDSGDRGATDFASFAGGFETKASGPYSVAMGSNTIASGDASTAMGNSTEASNIFSTSMGVNTIASGRRSTAMGSGTLASGSRSTAMGNNAIANGDFSIAMGDGAETSGLSSTAMGNHTMASGSSSTAMGGYTEASGSLSTAMGSNTTASGNNSTAMGLGTTALGTSSTAMGNNAFASGANSTAIGLDTYALGINSTAIGNNTIATGANSLAIGEYNIGVLSAQFVIGNGISQTNRNNALTVLKNGNIIVGGSVTIQNAADSDSSWRFTTLANGHLNLYRNDSYRGYFNQASGAYTQGSDRRLKKDITSLTNGTLDKVMLLNPVSYLMKEQTNDKRHLGLISQEVQEIFPSITHYVEEQDLLALSYTELIPILIKALQEQQTIIEGQNEKIDSFESSVSALLKRMEQLEANN